MQNVLITVEQATKYSKLTMSQIQKAITDRHIRTYTYGRKTLISLDDLGEYLAGLRLNFEEAYSNNNKNWSIFN